MALSDDDVEPFLGRFLAGAAALGFDFRFELKKRPAAGRTGWQVLLAPAPGAALLPRRWAQVAAGLQALLEAALVQEGRAELAVEVSAPPAPTAHEAGELEEPGLVAAARAVALEAVRRGRPFALGPMTAPERRLVHQALGDVPEVWTQSEGDGIFRRLWVVPRAALAKGRPSGPGDAT